MIRRLSLLALVACAAGCQTYDFEPVQPLAVAQTTQSKPIVARNLKPNLMLLVDKSGSMAVPISATDPRCAACPACPANCPTRISDMKAAMGTFLTGAGASARMGLAVFPTDPTCAPTNALEVSLPPAAADDSGQDAINTMTATNINGRIQALAASGGTPTNNSLAYVGTYSGLLENDSRDDYVLLLTDGLPNCNDANANDCNSPNNACACTLSACTAANTFCRRGCLDRAGVVGAVTSLRDKNIKTIVVGFGADTAVGDGPGVLNAMAESGGFARTCPNGMDAECGTGNRCLAGNVCEKKFYQAANANELSAALQAILDIVVDTNACVFKLDSVPSDPRFLAVIVNGVNSAPGTETWQYGGGAINFQGALCAQIRVATPAAPVNVEVRIVKEL